MRKTLLSFVDDLGRRGAEPAFAHKVGLRIVCWSRERIRATAFQFARELEARGIAKGDRVLFWATNSPEWVAAFFGCLIRGVIVVPLDSQSAPNFAARVVQQTEPKLSLYSGDRGELDSRLPCIRLEELSDAVANQSPDSYPFKDIGQNDLVEIIYTSGTTGDPKGVCINHGNLLANITPLEEYVDKYIKWERLVHPIRLLELLPLSHVFGQMMGLFVSELIRGQVFFQDSLNPSEIIETASRQRISVIVTVPRLLDTLRDKIERQWEAKGEMKKFEKALSKADDQHFLKRWLVFRSVHRQFGWKFWAFVSGGATLSEDSETFWRRLGYLVVQGYGMTETASVISYNDPFETVAGSIGKTLPGQEVKLDESGEILVRGSSVSPGYWSKGVKPMTADEGWLPTGDIGEMDEEGNLYFKGRKKDIIATAAGLKIYPEDIEATLNRDPEVRDSAVIGIEGPLGPEPLAVLLLRDEHSEAEAIIKRANKGLSEYQQLRRWFVWPENDFPRTTTTRKVRKRDVIEAVKIQAAGPLGRQPRPAGSLVETIARVSCEMPGHLDSSANLTTDLKLDSLGRVELMSALEDRYQVELDEAAFTSATTLGDIEKMIHEKATEHARPYPFPEWPLSFPATWIRLVILYSLLLPITRLMSWVRVRGQEHLRELRGPVMLICNHITMVDAALVMSALPSRFKRKLAIAMIGEMLRDWRYPQEGTDWITRATRRVAYWLVLCLFNAFSLPQESGFRRSFSLAGRLADRGYNLLVFPEGQRTHDGRMNPFMGGTGLMVAGLNMTIVPVKIAGLFELKQRRRYFALPGEITVTFGESVSYERGEDPGCITKDLETRIASL
ncbi:MAG TPA: AMP-binding protein [Blastocatellia bacterium]|nr:AMP-binding protein [Blastocatellia bacterium]